MIRLRAILALLRTDMRDQPLPRMVDPPIEPPTDRTAPPDAPGSPAPSRLGHIPGPGHKQRRRSQCPL